MDTFESMNEIFQSKDLLYCGKKLIEFAESAYKKKNRATLVKHFYEHLYMWAFSEYSFENIFDSHNHHYYICNNMRSVVMYLALGIPKQTTPTKSLNEIRKFGESIISNYTQPIGKSISKESLEGIMQFLDERYLFSQKVFSKQKAIFLRIPCSHRKYNSECLVVNTGKGFAQHFFLYHMRETDLTAPNPEAVLFHELGHAMHANFFDSFPELPDSILNLLQNLCFPKIMQLSVAEQCEVFADVLSVGLIYQTQWEKYDLFEQIHPDDKAVFKTITEKLLE